MSKRTPWYPASIKPVHVGWYEVWLGRLGSEMALWNAERWMAKDEGFGIIWHELFLDSEDKWRGLTRPAEE